MITVYGRPNSSNVAKVMWTLGELGLEHQRIDVGGPFGQNREPAYLAMNPNGLIPVLVDGDDVLWESNAIVRYLAARYGEGKLWSSNAGERARSDRWMDWGSLTFFPKVLTLMRSAEGAEREAAIAEVIEPCAIIDAALGMHNFLAGDQLSIGDLVVGVHLGRLYKFAGKLEFPNLERYYQHLLSRTAYFENCQAQLL